MEITIDIHPNLFVELHEEAERYNMTVEEYIEDLLEREHG